MFKCTGQCSLCGKCKKISEKNILTDVSFPASFKFQPQEGYGVAVDIGTTTIAATLWNLSEGTLVSQRGCHNPQKEYGSDIISRINYSNQGKEEYNNLHLPLRKTIYEMIVSMVSEANIDILQLKKAYFCGNTAMSLYFAGEDVSGLSSYPFTPEQLVAIEVESIFGLSHVKGCVLPGAGGQIGGDLIAGLLTVDENIAVNQNMTEGKNILFIDIGTNGEIALLTADKQLYVCSTAAGPAFEGSCISCGMPASSGAISKVNITGNGATFDTIHNASAEGICGSGIISTIRNLYDNKIVTKEGQLLDFDYYRRLNPFSSLESNFKENRFILQKESEGTPEIYISQKDIREFQLAKAAILSGAKVLLKEKNIGIHNIDTVYLSGGFSAHTPVNDILRLGIIPDIPKEKIKLAGNTALSGLSMALLSEDSFIQAKETAEKAVHIELSQFDTFQEVFLDSFNFS